jgi:hypothetical protein
MRENCNRTPGLDRQVLQQLHELRGLIAIDLVTGIDIRKGIDGDASASRRW